MPRPQGSEGNRLILHCLKIMLRVKARTIVYANPSTDPCKAPGKINGVDMAHGHHQQGNVTADKSVVGYTQKVMRIEAPVRADYSLGLSRGAGSIGESPGGLIVNLTPGV